MTENGQVCGGVEISETATEEGCGCKPNSDTLCTYEADTDPCFVCTFFDMKLPNGDCAGTCRTCAIDCGIPMSFFGCIDAATTMSATDICTATLTTANENCLQTCDCTKGNQVP